MTDELLILKFLERNYKITTGDSDFLVTDTYDEKNYDSKSFPFIFLKIIGDFTSTTNESSIEIFHRWYGVKKRELTKKLNEYFDVLDSDLGSKAMLAQALETFEKSEYTSQFILHYFNKYYNEKYLIPMLEEYVRIFDKTKHSSDLVDLFEYALAKEAPSQHDFSINYLNKWYCDTVISEKLNDFLSQLVITIGKTNWVVTWIGHGPITDDTLRQHFKKENGFQFLYIKGAYEEWYEKEVIEASERLMKKDPTCTPHIERESAGTPEEVKTRRIAQLHELPAGFLTTEQAWKKLDD